MNCNYKVKITDIQNKYQFKILCKGGANSTNVNDIYNLLPTTTNENTDIIISNTADIKAKAITIKGNTTQDGTPTPTSPVDVSNVTGLNTIKVENKNLFNKDNVSSLNASIDSSGTILSNNSCKTIIIPIKANTTYTIQKIASTQFRASVYDSSPAISSTGTNTKTNWSGTTITIESTTNSQYLAVFCYINTDTVSYQDILNSIQIEYGSTATSYVPHQEKDFIINFGDLEFAGIGTYKDYPFKENNKWYKYGAIGKINFDENVNWSYYSVTQGSLFRNTSIVTNYSTDNTFVPISDHYKGISYSNISNRQNNELYINTSNGALDIVDNRYTSASDFKTWVTSNNFNLYYPLKEPVITEITDTTLIKQLNNISNNIRTFEGGTNISSTSAGANPIINITTFNKLS